MTTNSSFGGYMAYQTPHHQEQHKYEVGMCNHSVSSQRSHHGSHGQQHQDYMSVGSHYSRSSMGSSHNSSQVDEAYRRLGHRLSIRAHGDHAVSKPPAVSRIGMTRQSGFLPYDAVSLRLDHDLVALPASPVSLNRTAKVAKTTYSDHGDHHKVPSRKVNVLRKMTVNATKLFRLMQPVTDSTPLKGKTKHHSTRQRMRHGKPQDASEDVSPQRFAFSQLALDGSIQHTTGSQHAQKQAGHTKHRLLSAVIEASSQASSQSYLRGGENNSKSSQANSLNSSIATRSSLETKSSIASYRTLPKGKCLTRPPASVANEGLDNADGNLVVHENDVIRISRKQIHVLTKDKMRDVTQADFRIQSLLGQGTFAQVFECLHLQTGNLVAIKIVKNKPAYTRQAAVEIDVFRALTTKQEKSAKSSMSQNHSIASNSSADGAKKWDYMVDLVCYFLYKSHLCLVFELLGLNLYEVLKQRQFRGLPLPVVRTLVKQAVGGVSELAKKSIVHCDLKPENILLVTDDDVHSVVGARRSSNNLSSFEKTRGYPHTPASELTKAIHGNQTTTSTKQVALASGLSKALGGTPWPAADDDIRSPGGSLGTAGTKRMDEQKIKLIDFGSACFEGQTSHTYIQSRFYRSPEVLIGLPYDSAIDMWSLGCVAAELFLGLPILPGVHEHDQLGRISEMISLLPNWMLDQGSKSSKYFVKDMHPRSEDNQAETPELQDPPSEDGNKAPTSSQPLTRWRIRSQEEYIASLSQNEIKKKGGLAKLEKQPTNRYFKKKKLAEIISHKGRSGQPEDGQDLEVFIHFLYGILNPDPWKRWTAHQSAQHPFITGAPIGKHGPDSVRGNKKDDLGTFVCDLNWEPPLDPGICRRKLLNVQKVREMHQSTSRGGCPNSGAHGSRGHRRQHSAGSYDGTAFTRGARMSDVPDKGSVGPHLGQQRILRIGDAKAMPPPAPPQPELQMNAVYRNEPNVAGHFAGDAMETISVAGSTSNSQQGIGGPQSYSDAVYSGMMQGSYGNLDFAYALRRPGVVPMGGSVASSVDTNISLQMQYLQDDYYHQQQNAGFYGTGLRNQHYGVQEMASDLPVAAASHSFGAPLVNAAPSTNAMGLPAYNAQGNWVSQAGFPTHLPMNHHGIQHVDNSLECNASHIGSNTAIPGDMMLYGNAQVYLQQQHAALQQQQALLQQQQAALALQQQQLQAYGTNPTVLNPNQLSLAAAQFNNMDQCAQGGEGYYYVASADGNPTSQGMGLNGMAAHNSMGARQQQNVGGYGNPRFINSSMMGPPASSQYRGGMSM